MDDGWADEVTVPTTERWLIRIDTGFAFQSIH